MFLTLRQKKLLICLLNEDEYKGSKYFAKALGISVRTLYKEISLIQDFISDSCIKIDKKTGVGIKIILDDTERLKLINSLNLGIKYVDELSTEKRIINIALKLLYEDDYVSMQNFANKYIVSKTSIANDIDKIEKTLKVYNLKIDRCYKGIKIIGNEKGIRQAINYYIKLITKEDIAQKCKYNENIRLDQVTYNQLLNFFTKAAIKYSEECIIRLEKQLKYNLTDVQYFNLVLHLLILIKRVKMGKTTKSILKMNNVTKLKSYNMAKKVLEFIGDKLDIDIEENEIIYFTKYILGCNTDIPNFNTSKLLQGQINDCINQMCNIISNILGINIEDDDVLKKGILLHIIPMINRCKYGVKIDNPILNDIREQYYSIYSITQLLSFIIEDNLNITINESEVGYLTLHFAAAVERFLIKNPKRVLVVCYGGIGTSQLLANRITNLILNIKIIDVIPSGKLNEIDTKDIDFIISTVSINYDKKPVIKISPLLSEKDINKLNGYILTLLNNNLNNQKNHHFLLEILDRNLIFIKNSMPNKIEVIKFLCDKMLKENIICEDYVNSVLDRENISSTYIGNFIAIPHGSEKYVKKEKIIICSLKNAVSWDNGKVKLVFLICIKTQNKNKFKQVLKSLYNLFDDKKCIEKIINCSNSIEVYKVIENSNLREESNYGNNK